MNDGTTPPFGSRWRHKKTGNVYKVRLGSVTIEATMTEAVVYYREDNTPGLWVRPTHEFLDGRFERLEDRKDCGCTYTEACICDDPDFN